MMCRRRRFRKNKMQKLFFSLLLLLSLSLLAGCDKPSDDHPFFPLEEGRSWTYKVEVTFDDPDGYVESSMLKLSNMGRVELNGAETWRRRSDSGSEYWLRVDEKGVYRVASRSPTGKQAVLDASPRTVIPAKLTPDQTWSVSTVPYFIKRRNEWPQEFKYIDKYRQMTMNYSVQATDQKVTTPAGDFTGCLLIKGVADMNVWVENEMTYKEVPMVNLEWYCPNMGLVQLERREPTTARFFQGGVLRMTLVKTN